MTVHNRVMNEAGKGVEALRHDAVTLHHTIAGAASPVGIIGPFPVDIDAVEVDLTAGLVPTDNAANRLNVFNGTVAGAAAILAEDISSNSGTPLVAQVPQKFTSLANTRVLAGTPICVQLIAAGDDAAASAEVTCVVYYEIPIDVQGARIHTYDAYSYNPD